MSIFDRPLFDFNGDGQVDAFEAYVGMQMMASSRKEAIELTGDDAFYDGDDALEDDDSSLDVDSLLDDDSDLEDEDYGSDLSFGDGDADFGGDF